MKREKKLILVSHCVLNQNSVVLPLARAEGPFTFVDTILKNNIGIYQLPCPEFKFGGLNRKPMSKEEYDTPKYRELCKTLSSEVINDIIEYIKNEYKIIGIIGINQSPTCSISEKKGIFMEEIFEMLVNNNITLPYIEVPAEYEENIDSLSKLNSELLTLI